MPLDKLMGSIQGNPALSGALSGAAGGALVSALTGKKSAKKLLKGAGMVAVGGMAWKAYQTYRDGHPAQVAAPQVAREDFEALVDATPDHAETTALVLQAMISAAHADGHLTDDERKEIWQKALTLKIPSSDLAAVEKQLQTPMPVEYFAASAEDLATRIDIYAATLLIIDEECDAGRGYLATLAMALELPAGLVSALHTTNQLA